MNKVLCCLIYNINKSCSRITCIQKYSHKIEFIENLKNFIEKKLKRYSQYIVIHNSKYVHLAFTGNKILCK